MKEGGHIGHHLQYGPIGYLRHINPMKSDRVRSSGRNSVVELTLKDYTKPAQVLFDLCQFAWNTSIQSTTLPGKQLSLSAGGALAHSGGSLTGQPK